MFFFFFNYNLVRVPAARLYFYRVSSAYNFLLAAPVTTQYDYLNNQSAVNSVIPAKLHPVLLRKISLLLLPVWNSLVFKGKSFRIKFFPCAKKITLSVGYSHWTKLRLENTFICFYKLRRQRFFFFSSNIKNYCIFVQTICKFRYNNVYTGRGVRLATQGIAKRFGKVSQAFSGLH